MVLDLVHCSIETDQGRTLYATVRVSLVSWEGRSCNVVYGSVQSSGHEAHGVSAMANI